MKQEIKKEKTKERMEYLARTAVCVLESVDEFLGTKDLSENEKMNVLGALICEMAREMSQSYAGVCTLVHVSEDIKNSLRNLPAGETQGAMQ